MIYISNGDNMKKTSITKKRKKMKLLFTFSMLILGIIASYKTLDNKKIVINEILAENKGNFKNENDEYSGYIEIKNISDESINIKTTLGNIGCRRL